MVDSQRQGVGGLRPSRPGLESAAYTNEALSESTMSLDNSVQTELRGSNNFRCKYF